MRLRPIAILCALLTLGASATAQKRSSRAPGSAPRSRTLVGGSGSSHKGGHYVRAPRATAPRAAAPTPRRRAVASAPRVSAPRATVTPRPRATAKRVAPSAGGVARDSRGRIARSESAKRAFEKQTGHPGGWKGHVVDHIVPLACGGADAPSNMQWQTVDAAKAKDKVERTGCQRP